MTSQAKSPLETFRARRALQGFVRVEVNVHRDDAALVREVASALSDPSRQVETRRLLRQRVVQSPKTSLKALLAAAPFDGINLERDRDFGRDVDL